MNKILLTLAITTSFLFSLMATAMPVGAVNVFPQCSQATKVSVCDDVAGQNKSKTNPIYATLKTVLNVVSLIAGITAVIMIIVAGLRFMLSNGDAGGIKTARDSLIYSVIGIIVVIFSQTIVAYVLNNVK